MNKLLKFFHWCTRKEEQILSYLDKKQYGLVIGCRDPDEFLSLKAKEENK